MSMDIHTLAFVLGLVGLVEAIALFAQYRLDRIHPGRGWWALGRSVAGRGVCLRLPAGRPRRRAHRDRRQQRPLRVQPGVAHVGVPRFPDRHERRGRLVAFCTVVTLIIIHFTYLDDDLAARRVCISVAVAAMSFLIARALFAHRTRALAASSSFLAVVFLVGGGFFVGGAFAPTPTQTVTYLVVLIASVLWAFGLIVLVSQRLTAEDREANENLKLVFNTSPDATVIGRPRDGAIVDVAASSSPLKAAKRRRFQLNQEAGRKRVAGAHASG